MNEKPDITDHILIKLAGEGAFERGEDYYYRGVVGELNIRGNRISAEVEGSESYQVKLIYTQKNLEGSCDCPASDGIDFCKHCVATAMVLRQQLTEPVVKKGSKPVEIITAYLQKQSKDQLVAQLTQLINDDKNLRQEWLIKAENSLGLLDKKTIRKRITAAVPYNRNYYKYSQVRQYFATIEQTFEQLEEPIGKLSAEDQVELLNYAFERINKAQETVDDSGGFRYGVIGQIQALYFEAFGKLELSDEAKAEYMLKLLIKDDSDHGNIPEDYSEYVSEECLNLFDQKVQTRWDALPKLTSDDWDAYKPYSPLLRTLEVKPRSQNDLPTLIKLYKKVARHPRDYIRLAQWHIELKQYDEAQIFVTSIQRLDKHGRIDEAHILQQSILLATDRKEEALEQQWEAFKNTPVLRAYETLKDIAIKAHSDKDWKQTVCHWLQQHIAVQGRSYQHQQKLDCLLLIYLSEKEIDQAWELANEYPFDLPLLHEMAIHLHYDLERATTIYAKMAETHVSFGSNDRYHTAIALLKELNDLTDTPEHQSTMSQVLQQMRVKFKAKRNFIKWLNEAFPIK